MRLIRISEQYINEIITGRIGAHRPQLESCALTLGSFDGLHRGHLELIKQTVAAKNRLNLADAVVFTFLQHPRQVLGDCNEPFLLTTWREKLSLLHDTNCPVIVAVDFCKQLAQLEYQDFVQKFLCDYLGMKHLVAGYDVHLGSQRGGTAESLARLGKKSGFSLDVLTAVTEGDQIISSSQVRRAISSGMMEKAAAMLGRPYAVWGQVCPGDRRGHQIGYPTANIQPLDSKKLLPEPGVYAVRIQVPSDVVAPETEGVLAGVTETLPEVDLQGDLLNAATAPWSVFGGMLNFGYVPTFHGTGLLEPRLEANIFGFAGDLRGRNVKIEWFGRLRSERKFNGAQELVRQLATDEEQARQVLADNPI